MVGCLLKTAKITGDRSGQRYGSGSMHSEGTVTMPCIISAPLEIDLTHEKPTHSPE